MYCPKCGQQQVSDEMRFCSRCGLALTGLAEWLGGAPLAAPRAEEPKKGAMSRRRKGIRRSAKLMFFSGVLFPVFLAISIGVDEAGPLVIPLLLFFVSLVWMLYARLFSDNTVPGEIPTEFGRPAQTSTLGAQPVPNYLPPATTPPIPNTGRPQVRTNELAQPPSVTENTTRLLDQE